MTVLTDTQVVTASGGLVELGYVERTTSQSVTATTFAGASEVFATDLTFVADGSPVVVEFYAPQVTVGGTYIVMNLSNGSTGDLGQIGYEASSGTAKTEYRYTPSAGVQTLNVRAWVQSSTGSLQGGAGGSGQFPPILLRVSKIVQATQWPAVTTGTIICTSSTRPASPFAGQQIYETDTSKSLIYNGTAWVSPQAQTVPPMVMARRTSSQTLTQNTLTAIQFDGTNVFDTNLMHSDSSAAPTTPPASNNTRITIKTAGVYQLNGWGYFAGGSTTSYRIIGFSKNGTEILTTNPKSGSADNRVQASLLDSAAVNDYYEVVMYHDYSAPLGLSAVSGVYAMFSAHFIGKTA